MPTERPFSRRPPGPLPPPRWLQRRQDVDSGLRRHLAGGGRGQSPPGCLTCADGYGAGMVRCLVWTRDGTRRSCAPPNIIAMLFGDSTSRREAEGRGRRITVTARMVAPLYSLLGRGASAAYSRMASANHAAAPSFVDFCLRRLRGRALAPPIPSLFTGGDIFNHCLYLPLVYSLYFGTSRRQDI